MKTVILCGGLGTRLSEETVVKPKQWLKLMDIQSYMAYNEKIFNV